MDGPSAGRAQGAHLPFLPTLAMALVAAGFSFLCQHGVDMVPAPAAPVVELAIGPTSFTPVLPAGSGIVRPAGASGALAFAQIQPLTVEAPEPRVASARAPRIAVAQPRRACPGPRCAETATALRRANPFAALRSAESEQAEVAPEQIGRSQGPDVPSVALPFAPNLAPVSRVVGEAAGIVRSGASSLGTSVVTLVDCLR